MPALQSERIAEPDEANYIETALRMPRTDFDPGAYLHGSLPYDLLAIEMVSLYLVGRATGRVERPEAFAAEYLDHPERFLVAARLLVLLTFLVAMWGLVRLAFLVIEDPGLALVASLLLQTSPAILFCCWYVKAEAFALAGLAWAAFLAVAARDDSAPGADPARRRLFLLGGSAACFGLAVSSGYLAVLAAPMLALLIWPMAARLGGRDRVGLYVGYGVMSFVAFVIAQPYGILHLDRLLAEVSQQRRLIESNVVPTLPLWGKIIRDYYGQAIGLPTSAAIVGALVVAAARVRNKSEHGPWALLAYPFLTFLYFGAARGAFYRYFALTIPFLLLFAVLQLDRLAPRLGTLRRLCIVGLVALASVQAWRSWQFAGYLAQPSTASVAKAWIESNLPPGSPVVVEGLVVDQVFWCPQLPKTLPALERELEQVRSRGGSGGLVKLRMERCCGDPASGFDVREVPAIGGGTPVTAGLVVLCLDDDPPFQPIWNVEPTALAKASRERADARQGWLETGACRLVHASEPSVRTRGPLIDTVDFAAIYAGGHGRAFSGPRISVYRCAFP